jgi:CheY-like chemotaxis protein
MAHVDRAAPDTRPGLRVLVVDDDRDAADSLAMLLELWGHRPRVAYGAEAALRAAADEPPDVVLLDLGLPGMDGFKLAAGLRALNGTDGTVFFAVTGHTLPTYRDRAKACRFAEVLLKPVEPETFRKLLADQQTARTNGDPGATAATGLGAKTERLAWETGANSGQSHRTVG